ncbi:MAG TPA: methyltransferase domain-containing protein [Chloroflexota bacterium]|nr:methyltransferase domain-containing protein [Chloroflexota bacterium]
MAALTTERATPTSPALTQEEARAALAAEWRERDPRTPEEIAAFYRETANYGPDLDAWHRTPERRAITDMIVHVARESGAQRIIDVGCGAGHDLLAIHAALPDAKLIGVEPNDHLRALLPDAEIRRFGRVDGQLSGGAYTCPVESADLLLCLDVLEHVPDPESFLGGIAQRAKIGCLLFETTASHDTSTPLHLKANWGWHPGRVLERHGWEVIDRSGRVRVWRRVAEAGRERASLLLCAYRSVSAETMTSILALCAGDQGGWRQRTKTGDALIARSRAIIVTRWYHETNDDVFLMVDDDLVFRPADADRLTELCRAGHDLVCGAYPVHDGGHLACRFYPGTGEVAFGPEQPIREIEYAATGFMAVHRRVIEALVADLPLCHANQPWGFYPLFAARVVYNEAAGVHEWLSEDWSFCQAAREHGFRCWLDPQTVLTHLGAAGVSVRNMGAFHAALQQL